MEIKPFIPVPNVITQVTKMPSAFIQPTAPPAPSVPPVTAEGTPPAPPIATEVPKEEEKAKFDSEKFMALTRKEKEMLQEKKQIQRERELLEQERLKFKPFQEAFEASQKSKLEGLKRLGISYEDLTNEMLTQDTPSPEHLAELKAKEIVAREMDAFRKEQEKVKGDQEQRMLEQARTHIASQARELATDDKYPLVKAMEAFDTISSLVEQTYYEKGIAMPIEQAVAQVEAYLEEKTLGIAKLEKIRSKLFPIETPKPVQAETPVRPLQQPKTLTHQTMATQPAPKSNTDAERMRRAIEIFYGRG